MEDAESFANWRARCERDLEHSALVDIRISTQDVSVLNKDVKMTFTRALANLGETSKFSFNFYIQ